MILILLANKIFIFDQLFVIDNDRKPLKNLPFIILSLKCFAIQASGDEALTPVRNFRLKNDALCHTTDCITLE